MFTPFCIREFLLEVLYPPTCVGCEADGTWLCTACLATIAYARSEDGLVALGHYADPSLRCLLTHLKYRSAICVLESLREFVRRFRSEHIRTWPWAGEPSVTLCGVPSDERRVRERGLDHVECLLDIVHAELVPWATRINLLRRTKHVVQNAALPATQLRQPNVYGIFKVSTNIAGAVLLVDDVYTTGATWNEAARVLRRAGASQVYGLVFAKG